MKSPRHLQTGQALAEFLVCMAVLLPVLLGVYYVGKYADLQQSAVQASRYAAFQRTIQPDQTRLTDATIQNQLRVRFFARGDRRNGNANGVLRSNDGVTDAGRNDGVLLWRDLTGNPLLANLNNVTLTSTQQGVAEREEAAARAVYGMPRQTIHVANVEVALLDRLTANAGANPLRIGATTAATADGFNAQGSVGVQNTLRASTGLGDVLGIFRTVGPFVSTIVRVFEDHEPVLPCLRVESVPADRTSDPAAAGSGSCG